MDGKRAAWRRPFPPVWGLIILALAVLGLAACQNLADESTDNLPAPTTSAFFETNTAVPPAVGEGDTAVKSHLIEQLRAYCRLDTLAMVEIHRVLSRL